jgi:hypothetical protein
MPVIDFSTLKSRFLKVRRTSLLKVAACGLSLTFVLTFSVFTSPTPAAEQPAQGPALPEETSAGESFQQIPYVSDPATTVSSLVYIKPDKVTSAGKLLTFTIAADDADGDTLFYSAASLPDGSSFDADTGLFSWTPRYDQAGIYSVHFEVSDGDLTDSEDVVITVIQLYDNWDVNGDSDANVLDMVLVGQHWGESGLTGWILEDTNEDGNVDVLDIIIIGQHWTG